MPHLNSEFARVAIVGVGLIGGSVALASRKWGGAETVIGYGRNRDRLTAAQKRGVIDEIATTPDGLRNVDLVVVCTPVDRIAEDVLTILRATEGTPALVTDAGSVKNKLQQAISAEYSGNRYIGAHPLAGSHHTGFEHASANLFLTRMCIVSPKDYPEVSPETARICHFWEQIGMKVKTMSAAEHDRTLALTSHLPHLTASAVSSAIEPEVLSFAATGYRDTTRVAAGDPELWAAILEMNSAEMVRGVDRLVDVLSSYRKALINQDKQALRTLLQHGAENRRHYQDDSTHPDDGT
ncbi:prephenate dehydrogenase [Planctomicrobium sp. SH527]|uniref:prephenate dehydrogenase n=1 Tax=Planctomicrobium sp. SH527 TaxID=3448123 RepID=UPI003F5B6208